jgi:hypothetical protein
MLVEEVVDQLPVTPLTLGECVRRSASAAAEVGGVVRLVDCHPLRRNGSSVKAGRRCGGDEANRHSRSFDGPVSSPSRPLSPDLRPAYTCRSKQAKLFLKWW